MSVTPEREPLGSPISLFAHALRLHQQHPDGVLPRDGEPYPDEAAFREHPRPRDPADRRLCGAGVAGILDTHFGTPGAHPSELVGAFREVDVPIHRNDHITAAALRADRRWVQRTGRWLVRHSPDRQSATVGLALLAADRAERDIPLIQTIGLLSERFAPLAAAALRRRRGGEAALLWLARRVAGWGRVYVVEELCRYGVVGETRDWLLRYACDGDYLNGYFAGQVAVAAHLHEAITRPDPGDDLVDHTGRLLRVMTECSGMGATLRGYPPASAVLTAHVSHLARQAPAKGRYVDAAMIADYLAGDGGVITGSDRLLREYLAVLNQPGWCDAVRAGLTDPEQLQWFAGTVAARLRLRAFDGG